MKKLWWAFLLAGAVLASLLIAYQPFPEYTEDEDIRFYKQQGTNPCCDSTAGKSAAEEKKCTTCIAYAEAGADYISPSCMNFVMCVIKNRENSPEFPNSDGDLPENECEVISQPSQFSPYSCVGNPNYSNQKYCTCCDGSVNSKYIQLAQNEYDDLDCTGWENVVFFNNHGLNSWAQQHCTAISPYNDNLCKYTQDPDGSGPIDIGDPVFDFFSLPCT